MLEQIIYQTKADLSASYEAANESRQVTTLRVNRKGVLVVRLKLRKVMVEITSTGKVMFFWDSSWPETTRRRVWRILMKEVLRNLDHGLLTTRDIVWLKRFPYPGPLDPEIRLKVLIFDDIMDGSIESQLSVWDELIRTGRLKLKKATERAGRPRAPHPDIQPSLPRCRQGLAPHYWGAWNGVGAYPYCLQCGEPNPALNG